MQNHITVNADDHPWMIELYCAVTQQQMQCPECAEPDVHAFSFHHANEVDDTEQMVARVSATCANCETVVHCEMPHWLWWSGKALKGRISDCGLKMLNGKSIAEEFWSDSGYDINAA